MKHLYLKYIQSDTELQISIDYEEYERLNKIFKDDDNNNNKMDVNYFTVFDCTAIQVIRLIRGGSFHRFKHSILFDKFKENTSINLNDPKKLKSNPCDPKIYFSSF